jgi:endonuclease III
MLAGAYPGAGVHLDFRNAFQLLAATILAAQCTDERVNRVTPALFARFPDAARLAGAGQAELEQMIRSTGFYRNKARSLLGMANALVESFGGKVPETIEELVTIPGVGRKTANVLLGACFGQPAIVVDTHLKRVAARLGRSPVAGLGAGGPADPVFLGHRGARAASVRCAQTALPRLSRAPALPVPGQDSRVAGRASLALFIHRSSFVQVRSSSCVLFSKP